MYNILKELAHHIRYNQSNASAKANAYYKKHNKPYYVRKVRNSKRWNVYNTTDNSLVYDATIFINIMCYNIKTREYEFWFRYR